MDRQAGKKELTVSNCRGCNADILWLPHNVTGKVAPIDAYPDLLGNVLINREAGTWRVATKEEQMKHPDQLHHSHFTTCPYSKQFRTRGRK